MNKCKAGDKCTRFHVPKVDGKQKICYWHNTVKDCNKGDNCKFLHFLVGADAARQIGPPARSRSPAGKGGQKGAPAAGSAGTA